MDVQFRSSGFEVDIAEGFEAIDFECGILDENAAVTSESFEVGVALSI